MLTIRRLWRRRIRMPRFRVLRSLKKAQDEMLVIFLFFMILCITLYTGFPDASDKAVVKRQKMSLQKAINAAVSDKITSGELD
jgi:hypothetical protein